MEVAETSEASDGVISFVSLTGVGAVVAAGAGALSVVAAGDAPALACACDVA